MANRIGICARNNKKRAASTSGPEARHQEEETHSIVWSPDETALHEQTLDLKAQ
jgi:hypothetical protein